MKNINRRKFLGLSALAGAGAFLDSDGWIASASVHTDDASKTLDRDMSTRWSTLSERQKPGQWFMVDMREIRTFTGIYLDAGDQTYRPSNVTVSVSSDGENWINIATVNNADQVTFEAQTARYIRVTQNGNSTSAWRIVEFYAMNTYLPPTSIQNPQSSGNINVWFDGSQLFVRGLEGKTQIKVYNTSGQLMESSVLTDNSIYLNLPKGMYIISLENNRKIYRQKLVKQ